METPATLEVLVKLASFGTAGVCVLAIFIIGISIFRLSNDTPEWKVSLMKKYMNVCIIIAIICTISGSANAYFNRNKIVAANDKYDKLGAAYDAESQNVEMQKRELTEKLMSFQRQVEQNNKPNPEAVRTFVESANMQVQQIQLRPREEILNINTEARPIRKSRIEP